MNQLHPTVILEGDVQLGERNTVLPYTLLRGPLELGDDNTIGPHAVIGGPGEDTRDPYRDDSRSLIRMGSRNIVREHGVITKPCYEEVTSLGDELFLMGGAHVCHDVQLEDKVVLAPSVSIAGLARVMEGANLAMGACLHQRSVVGAYAIVAMGAAVTKNVKPFSRYIPGRPLTVNHYAVEKFGFSSHAAEIAAYVLEDLNPTSARVLALVERYHALHLRSQRGEYR